MRLNKKKIREWLTTGVILFVIALLLGLRFVSLLRRNAHDFSECFDGGQPSFAQMFFGFCVDYEQVFSTENILEFLHEFTVISLLVLVIWAIIKIARKPDW